MNKLTKIGLTALAGSLASIAGAQAGSLSVAGGVTVTHTTTSGNATGHSTQSGNPIGMTNNLTITGSGELDNGISWTANAYNSDAQALTSSNLTFDLAGAGSLLVDFGAGGMGIDSLDDWMPTAWQESWDTGAASGVRTVSGIHGSAAIQYTTPADALPFGASVELAWSPKVDGGGLQADQGNSQNASALAESGWDANLILSPVDGLTIKAGYSDVGQTGVDSNEQGTYGFTYSAGAFTFGMQQSYIDVDSGATSTINYYDNLNWGVAFNVNDNLSISYADYESEENMGTTGGQTLTIDSVQVAYNMGGATFKLAETEVSDAKYTAAVENSATTVALSLAF